jgi:hypothetical protein
MRIRQYALPVDSAKRNSGSDVKLPVFVTTGPFAVGTGTGFFAVRVAIRPTSFVIGEDRPHR